MHLKGGEKSDQLERKSANDSLPKDVKLCSYVHRVHSKSSHFTVHHPLKIKIFERFQPTFDSFGA